VVIGVVADILEVVVFAAGADAFLGIGGARWIVGGFFDAEEIGDEGVHPGIREQQAGRLREQRGGGDDGVLFFLEEIEEGLADLGGCHGMILGNWDGAGRPWHGLERDAPAAVGRDDGGWPGAV
jgi:hypothetical protein